jgi:DNA repair photolyase
MLGKNIKGRGAGLNTPNPFEAVHFEEDESAYEESTPLDTEYFWDSSKSILSKNRSPDLYFDYSINPYRGCEHGCIYCYARPTHEYLGFSAGLDFESKIVIKKNAAELLRKEFSRPGWKSKVVLLSGNTDPYQPVERRLRITRDCIRVFRDFGNPISIITKNSLICRDLDLIAELAEKNLVSVTVSITSLEDSLIGEMEPRTSRPSLRLKTVRRLAEAGIPVGVNIAPVIPGLTDEEIPRIVEASSAAGATFINYLVLRLPKTVEPLFLEWLQRTSPTKVSRVVNRIKEIREGSMSDSRFGSRFRGKGQWADLLRKLFAIELRKHNLKSTPPSLSTHHFRLPSKSIQHDLFGSKT